MGTRRFCESTCCCALLVTLWGGAAGCSLELTSPDETGASSQTYLASGKTYAIHLSGACSNSYNAELGQWSGVISVSARVDQNDSMATATADLKGVLNQYCLGDNWCYLFTYSNGGGVISKVFAESSTPWNIAYVINSASNEGGSELGELGFLSDFIACDIATEIRPSIQRSWNHNDTNGNTFYMIGGYNGMFVTSWALPGEDDGVVAYHSSAGASTVGSFSNLCVPSQWANHYVAGSCEGYDLTHAELKRKHICLLGGGGSPCH